ncbi:MAG TPA: TIGR03560 family F420-dependent LLM class oxidoreductase [bacterium]|nr:TIGR03560 family F420-dependent LLM class oxidoreductase [bacterium]
MAVKIGLHAGPQDISMADLQKLWRRADSAGFHWISVWDHFYANPIRERTDPCFEGVAAMTALAASTSKARVACLVFCTLFRNPGLLAKSMVTVDHLSGGRAEVGLGAGWFEEEFHEFGYDFGTPKERMDRMEESVRIIKALLHEGQAELKGQFHQISGAVCAPRPVQKRLRVWIGGRGAKRTPRMAAQYADGFNMAYPSPEEFQERNAAVDQHCERFQRDPKAIERSVNLHFLMHVNAAGEARAKAQRERMKSTHQSGMLLGGPQQVLDQIGAFQRAGAQGVNIAIRPPVDWDALEGFIQDVLPHAQR